MSLLLEMLRESEEVAQAKISSPAEPTSQPPVAQPKMQSITNGLDLVWLEDEEFADQVESPASNNPSSVNDPNKNLFDNKLFFENEEDTDFSPPMVEPEPVLDQNSAAPFPMLLAQEDPMPQKAIPILYEPISTRREEDEPPIEPLPKASPTAMVDAPIELSTTDDLSKLLKTQKSPAPKFNKQAKLLGSGAALLCGLLAGGYFYYETMTDESTLVTTPPRKIQPPVVDHRPPVVTTPPSPMPTPAPAGSAPAGSAPAGHAAPAPTGPAPTAPAVGPAAPSAPAAPAASPASLERTAQGLINPPTPQPPAQPVTLPVIPPEAIEITSAHLPNGLQTPPPEQKLAHQLPSTPTPSKDKPGPAKKIPVVAASRNPLNLGRKAFLTGDLTTAKQHFEQASRNEPHNHAAMAGLASIAIRENKKELARSLYQTILQENPQNSLALANMISLTGHTDLVQLQSQLNQMLHDAPNEAPLHFALGNIHVEQKNWPEAQTAFFNAHRLDPGNPDILLNLAVSLDQLRQDRTALQYYREALKATSLQGKAGFDTQSVQRRIAILEQRVGGS